MIIVYPFLYLFIVYPEDLKIAVLSPIFKKGDRSSSFRKVLVRNGFDQLCKYFDDNNIISNEQSRFRKNGTG